MIWIKIASNNLDLRSSKRLGTTWLPEVSVSATEQLLSQYQEEIFLNEELACTRTTETRIYNFLAIGMFIA